jgi:hypothetical protein
MRVPLAAVLRVDANLHRYVLYNIHTGVCVHCVYMGM